MDNNHVCSDNNGVNSIKKPYVSILIVSFNTCDLLKDCLSSVLAISYDPFEVIVVDNGSTDGSVEMVTEQFPQVRLMALTENTGFVGGNMLAYGESRGKYVCFLNSDTTVSKNFLDELVGFLEANTGVACAEPKILWMRDTSRIDSIGDYLTWTGMLYHRGYLALDEGWETPFPIFSAKGACMLFRRSVLDKIGVFDENYFAYFEETDLCWRAWLAGYAVYFVPSATVTHLLAGSSRGADSYLVNYHSFKNRINSMIKNYGLFELIKVMPVHVTICVLLAVIYAIRGQRAKAKAIIHSLAWNVVGLRDTLRKRAYVQNTIRQISDRDLMKIARKKVSATYFLGMYRDYEDV